MYGQNFSEKLGTRRLIGKKSHLKAVGNIVFKNFSSSPHCRTSQIRNYFIFLSENTQIFFYQTLYMRFQWAEVLNLRQFPKVLEKGFIVFQSNNSDWNIYIHTKNTCMSPSNIYDDRIIAKTTLEEWERNYMLKQ